MDGMGETRDSKPDSSHTVDVKRSLYTLEDYNNKYETVKRPGKSVSERLQQACTVRSVGKTFAAYFPVVKVIRKYKIKENLLGDVLAGLTVTFMHLPQGMAFGLLASLRPIYGLYSTFFPVLFYMIFGTSPYISFGTNAVMALLTQTVVDRETDAFITDFAANVNSSENDTASEPSEAEILHVKVGTAMACSLLSGLLLALMGIFKLGFLTSYLSTSFIGGFTTAAAVHIATSQIPKLFGIATESYSGPGKLILLYIDLFRKIGQTNVPDLVIAIVSLIILVIVKVGINERYKDKMKMPIPIDLVIVIVATIISHLAKFQNQFQVKIVGSIPSGFQAPTAPRFSNISNIIADSIIIGILSLALTITLAKLTAKKHGVKIDDSQEIFAYGFSNVFSSFFGCFPSGTAPPRTMILSSLGAKTTLNAIPTTIVFIFIILLIGQLFESLPIAVLAAMIIVSIKDLLLQYRNLPSIWKINKYDFVIWIVTNSTAVLLDLDYGLLIGVGVSILLVVVQNQMTSGYLVGVAKTEDVLYRLEGPEENNRKSHVAIFRFPVSLYFATAERFKEQIYKEVLNPITYLKHKKKMEKRSKAKVEGCEKEAFDNLGATIENGAFDNVGMTTENETQISENKATDLRILEKPKAIIIDCSMIQYFDIAGANMLQEIIKQYQQIEITLFLTGVSKCSESILTDVGLFKVIPKSKVFLEVFDAIEVLKQQQCYIYHL